MEHVTALVDHDATTQPVHACWKGGCPCSCAKLAAAGWQVKCSACGRGVTAEERARLLEPYAEFGGLDLTVQELGELGFDAGEDKDDWSSIEDYDVARDDRLVDEAERAVA